MNRIKLIILTAFLVTTVFVTGVFTTLPRFRTPAQVHAQDGRPQLYLNRAIRIDTHFQDGSIDGATPLSIASDDFDGDGIHDLAVGVSTTAGGVIALHRGNLDAFAPQSDASFWAIARSEFPSPYLREAQLVNIPSRPDFLAAGDFIGLNGPGVVAAARGGRTLHVVSRGDSGKLEVLQSLDIAGAITAVDEYQLRPGKYGQLVVGVRGESGPELRIYDGSQAGLTEVSRFQLAGDATAFAFGNLDGDLATDVLTAAGGELYVLHGGNQALEHVRLPFHTAAVALGSFAYDRESLSSMAVLATDGSLHILVHSQFDPRPLTTEELRTLRQSRRVRQAARVLPRQRPVSWKEIESFPGVATVDGSGRKPIMFRTRISSNALDDVMLLDASRLTVLTHPDANPTAGLVLTRSDLGADAVAAISERVNIDGRPGVVFTKNGDMAPYVMMPLPDPTFTVNRFDDPTPHSPISGACNTPVSTDCSLREAILKANATSGTDTIMVPNGTYTLTRARIASNFSGQQGTLEVTDSVNIVGAGMSTTIIQGGTDLTSSVDKVFSFNQDIAAFTTATVSVSNLTIQFGNNRGNVSIQDGWGGAFDFDTGGSNAATATATLMLTNVTLANNQTTDGEGGGFAIFNTNAGSGNATLTNTVVQNNKAQRSASTDPNGPGNGGGVAVLWPAKLTMNNTQVLTNTATQLGTGAGTGGGLYALGGGGTSNSVTIHGGSITGNTAPGDGGGIWCTAGLTINQGTVINNNTANGSGGGIWYNGDPGDPASLNKVTITGNQAKGTPTGSAGEGGGIRVGSAGQPVSISFSRIALNTAKSGGTQLHNQPSGGAGSAVTASSNWWGTNTPSNAISPTSSTCAAGAFQVCFNPFIKLNFGPGMTPILVGDTSTLTASFLTDSASNAVAAANLDVMAGVPIAFNNAQHGTLSGAQSAIQNVQGVASATESGNTVTITTNAPHGFTNTQVVTISGVGPGYDGQYTVGGATLTTFTYTSLSSLLPSLGPGGTATVPVGTATVTFTGTTVGAGTANAVIDGFTLTSSPIIAVNSPTTTAAANQSATYNDSNQNVTLSANITAACCTVAGGTVTFTVFNGATQIGSPATSGAVVSGNASATYVLPGGTGVATYSIHATYNGTSTGAGDFLTSSDNAKTLTVNAAPTTTSVANTAAVFSASNQTVPLSVTVTSANGTVGAGTVTFTVFDGGNNQVGLPVTSGTVTSGAASANFTLPGSTPIGSYSIHASYSGSTNFLASSDNAHTLTVNANTTTTASPASTTFSASNQTVPLSATVTSAAGTVNAGTVTFTVFNSLNVLVGAATAGTVSGGNASVNFTLPGGTGAGTYSIHASYGGSGNFLASSDNSQNLTVNAAGTTTTGANASASFSASNQSVTLSATVTSPSETVGTGTVTFTVFNASSVQVGAAATSGTVTAGAASANFTLPGGSPAGVYSVHATYNGTTNLLTSSDNTHTLTVSAGTTTTATPTSVTFSTSSQSVPLSATIISAGGTVNTGTVTFSVFNSLNVQVGSPVTSGVTNGSASVSFTLPGGTAVGTYSIHASYSGGTTFLGSSDNTHLLMVVTASTTIAAVSTSKTYSTASQSVALSATVSSTTTVNEGTVTFTIKNGAATIGVPVTSATVSGGAASANFTLPASTPAGIYTIQAVYNPGADFSTSSDSTHTLTVGKATPVITWANPADIVFGGSLSSTQLNATASTPGSFVYTPAVGAVLPVGNGQTLAVSFTPTDTADFNNATAGVLINVLPAPGPATLIMTQTLARDGGTNEVVVTLTLANTGGTAATGVQVSSAKIGTTSTTAVLPASMPDVPAGGSSSVVLRFPGSVGTAGARVVLSVSAVSSAGTLTASSRVVLP